MKRLIQVTIIAMLLAIVVSPVLAQDGKQAAKQTYAGAIESIDHQNGLIVVAGRTFKLDSETLAVFIKGAPKDIEDIEVEDYVALEFVKRDHDVVVVIRK